MSVEDPIQPSPGRPRSRTWWLNSKLTAREHVILVLAAAVTALVAGGAWLALGLEELLGPWIGLLVRGLLVGLGVFVVERVLALARRR